MKIIIIGGVAGGASAAARCRRLDENAEIIMFERGPVVSFSNCCLPYHISGVVEKEETLVLMNPQKFKMWFNIDARVNSNVISVNSNAKTIQVENTVTGEVTTEHYDALVVSPGADSVVPLFPGLEKIDNYCLKTVPDVSKIMSFIKENNPKHMTVVGGGFIGLEAAENLRERGIDVTLIEGTDQIIPFVDRDMSYFGQAEMVRNGVEIIIEDLVEAFDARKVILKSGKEIETDGVILAIGVKPSTGFLKDSGVELNERGYIKVDDNYQTTAKDVYAAGDAILVTNQLTGQPFPLAMAGPANKQGRLIADRINGRKINNKGYIGSGVVKLFDLNVASTGLSEKMLVSTGIEYDVVYAAPPGIVGIMPGNHLVYSKLIFEKDTGKILGAQFATNGAPDKRADVISTAIKASMTVEDLADLELCYAPPFGTGKDVVNKVGYIASNLNEGAFKQVRFSEVYDLLETGEQVIDVREAIEYEAGHIKGAVNIPMSSLRQRLDELDKTKPVYVHCRTGERSYNMTLMLKANGFDAYNVAGSYEFVKAYEEMMSYNHKNRKDIMVGNCTACAGQLAEEKSA
ncbi:pyridine nucleotide-disulfide oxidoreductase [Photobacterium proteolyticum]|uniref:Pyridine nucleotide-disulfide oxidoreductase n=1 Tax=Photobacterium proteolyticum TaxID=1903952 RepID=A0A1Q9H1Q4_9GAMM|nr:FAD-dependent oxidoreductase [Photobacterium proteolyticum]OLQ81605.1 pyridine nucleotide-disulfide oxidoreductase [Photobacterium proteolyticum]